MSCFASIFRRPCLPLHSAQSAPPVWAHVHSTHGSHLVVTCPPPSIALEALECFCGLRGRKETASIRLQSVAAFIVAGGFCYKRGQPETVLYWPATDASSFFAIMSYLRRSAGLDHQSRLQTKLEPTLVDILQTSLLTSYFSCL